MRSMGEWHLEVWVDEAMSGPEAERFIDEIADMLEAWSNTLTATPSGLAILRTEVSK